MEWLRWLGSNQSAETGDREEGLLDRTARSEKPNQTDALLRLRRLLVYHATAFFLPRGASFTLLTRTLAIPLSIFVAMLLFYFVERQFARGLETAAAFWPRRPQEPRPLGEGIPIAEKGS